MLWMILFCNVRSVNQSHKLEVVPGSNVDEHAQLSNVDSIVAHTVALGDHGNKTTVEETVQMSQ